MTERTHPVGRRGEPSNSGILPSDLTLSRRTAGDSLPALAIPDPGRPLAEQDPAVLLAMCVFGEARGESDAAQRAIAQVVLNRAKYPHPVFGSRAGGAWEENLRRVILQPGQFSSFDPTDPNYPKLLRPLASEDAAVWARCLHCAGEALAAKEQADTLTANSDHYFDDSIEPPSWADPAKRTVQLGRLNFYRLYLPRSQGPNNPPTAAAIRSSMERGLPPPTGAAEPRSALSPAPSRFRSADTLPTQEPPTAEPSSASPAPGGPKPPGSGSSPAARLIPGSADAPEPRASLPSEASAQEGPRCGLAGDGALPPTSLPCRVPHRAWISRRPKPQREPRTGRLSSQKTVTSDKWPVTSFQVVHQGSLVTRHLSLLFSLLSLCLLLAACNDFERTAYRTLAVTQAEYETIQRHVAEAAVHGLITEEQWERFAVEGHRFIDAHNAAVDALEAWSRAKSQANAARLAALLEILPRLVRDLNDLVRSLEEEQKQEATEPQRMKRNSKSETLSPKQYSISKFQFRNGSAWDFGIGDLRLGICLGRNDILMSFRVWDLGFLFPSVSLCLCGNPPSHLPWP